MIYSESASFYRFVKARSKKRLEYTSTDSTASPHHENAFLLSAQDVGRGLYIPFDDAPPYTKLGVAILPMPAGVFIHFLRFLGE